MIPTPVATAASDEDFLLRNSALRYASLLRVEGLLLFLVLLSETCLVSLVSKEKVKSEPTVTENLKTLPCSASAWQKSRHWVIKVELVWSTAVIFD